MDDGSSLPWIFSIFFLLCAAFCAMTETAFSSSSRPRLKVFAESGNRKAETALHILDNFDKAISTILVMTNIAHISIAAIVTVAVTKKYGLNAVSVSTLITTLVVFFAGEMLPKSIAKRYAERFAMFSAGPLHLVMTVFSPVSMVLTKIGVSAAERIKGEPELSVTEDELYDIIEDMTEEGALDEEQGDLISSAIQFADLTVESVLTPRVDMVAVDIEDSVEEILAVVKSCGHSRLPVFEGSVDNIIGILQIRRFIKEYLHRKSELNLRSIMDEPFFIYQGTKLDDVLPTMTRNRQSIAVVTDNYGGTLGLVTVEDLIEEIVGDIWDEEDVIEERVIRLEDGNYSVNADEKVSDVFEKIKFEDPEDNEELVNTVCSAWAYENFRRIPFVGDCFQYHGLLVSVEKMDHNRIRRLRLQYLSEEQEGCADQE